MGSYQPVPPVTAAGLSLLTFTDYSWKTFNGLFKPCLEGNPLSLAGCLVQYMYFTAEL